LPSTAKKDEISAYIGVRETLKTKLPNYQ